MRISRHNIDKIRIRKKREKKTLKKKRKRKIKEREKKFLKNYLILNVEENYSEFSIKLTIDFSGFKRMSNFILRNDLFKIYWKSIIL